MSAAPVRRFTVEYQEVTDLRHLCQLDRKLLARVLALAERSGACVAHNEFLADAMGCSERSITRGLGRLCAGGYLEMVIGASARVRGGRIRRLTAGPLAPSRGVDTVSTPRPQSRQSGYTSLDRVSTPPATRCRHSGDTHAESTGREDSSREYSDARARKADVDLPTEPNPAAAVPDTREGEGALARGLGLTGTSFPEPGPDAATINAGAWRRIADVVTMQAVGEPIAAGQTDVEPAAVPAAAPAPVTPEEHAAPKPAPAAAVADAQGREGMDVPGGWERAEAAAADREIPGGVRPLGWTTKQQRECIQAAQGCGRSEAWFLGWIEKARQEGKIPGAYARRMILANTDLETEPEAGSEAEMAKRRQAEEQALMSQAELKEKRRRGLIHSILFYGPAVARRMCEAIVSDAEWEQLLAEAGVEVALAPGPSPEPQVRSQVPECLTSVKDLFRGMFPDAAPPQQQTTAVTDQHYRETLAATRRECQYRRQQTLGEQERSEQR